MRREKVSKNLYRGRNILLFIGLIWLYANGESVAYRCDDGSYLVRPAGYFLRWGEEGVRSRLGRFYSVIRK